MTNDLKEKWLQLSTQFSDDSSLIEDLWNEIEKQYSLKIRHYHNLSHIKNMLSLSEIVRDSITDINTFLFAIWYHDIIYKPIRKDNEEKSASFALKRLKTLNINEQKLGNIQNLIVSTKKHDIVLMDNSDNAFLLDIDLSVLGSDWDTYKKYTQNIRNEYAIYPDFMYTKGRKNVLKHFLERKTLYFTKVFQDKFEEQARENLKKEIELL